MPQTHRETTPDPVVDADQPSRLSRRSVLRGVAGAGAVGLVAAGGAAAATGLAGQDHPARPASDSATDAQAGPVMVYLRAGAAGEMDVFAGTRQTRLRNPALVRALLHAIQ
jgi:hypothetical protein